MKIEVVRAFWLDGKTRDAGDVFDVPDALGHELIGLRKAIGHVESEPKPARARKAKAEAETADEPEAA